MSGPSANEQFVVMDARRRRSPEEKQAIVAELLMPGASVSAIARKHNVASSLLFRWRKQHGDGKAVSTAKSFVPVVVAVSKPVTASTIEITLANGRQIKVDQSVDPTWLKRVVEALDGR